MYKSKLQEEAQNQAAELAFHTLSTTTPPTAANHLFKSLLNELTQRRGCNPEYETKRSGGPSHMPTFVSTVKVMGKQFHGKACRSKKEAEHDVAKIAYNALKDCPRDEGSSSSCGKSPFEDLHGLPDDDERVASKKLKTGSPPPLPPLPERELPEYPFDKSFNAGNFISGPTFDHQLSSPPSRLHRHEGWKWEGIIAMGGTPVFRAHCFPVGKVLDMPPLPELLDCTTKTSLDMLSKHYYQAVGVWVVFFLPESDAGKMELYKKLMHYLEEEQRAAVSDLDSNTTLFLVPPSNFSEKVLKVPGSKLIISGVILRFDCSGIPLYGNTSNSYNLEMRHFDPLSTMPVGSLPLAQLAASLPEQQRQTGRSSLNASTLGDPRHNNRLSGSENNRMNYEPSMSQFGQVQQLQKQKQISNVPQMSQMMVQREPQRRVNVNQQFAGSSSQSQEDAEEIQRNVYKQQLAADLLKQIQQGKGT